MEEEERRCVCEGKGGGGLGQLAGVYKIREKMNFIRGCGWGESVWLRIKGMLLLY